MLTDTPTPPFNPPFPLLVYIPWEENQVWKGKDIKLLSWNVEGAMNDLRSRLAGLIAQQQPDLIALQGIDSTYTLRASLGDHFAEKYGVVHSPSGRGMLLYKKAAFTFSNPNPPDGPHLESPVSKLVCKKSNTPLYVLNTHLQTKSHLPLALENSIRSMLLLRMPNKSIVVGDFNHPLAPVATGVGTNAPVVQTTSGCFYTSVRKALDGPHSIEQADIFPLNAATGLVSTSHELQQWQAKKLEQHSVNLCVDSIYHRAKMIEHPQFSEPKTIFEYQDYLRKQFVDDAIVVRACRTNGVNGIAIALPAHVFTVLQKSHKNPGTRFEEYKLEDNASSYVVYTSHQAKTQLVHDLHAIATPIQENKSQISLLKTVLIATAIGLGVSVLAVGVGVLLGYTGAALTISATLLTLGGMVANALGITTAMAPFAGVVIAGGVLATVTMLIGAGVSAVFGYGKRIASAEGAAVIDADKGSGTTATLSGTLGKGILQEQQQDVAAGRENKVKKTDLVTANHQLTDRQSSVISVDKEIAGGFAQRFKS